MTLQEIVKVLEGRVLVQQMDMDTPVLSAYGCDLMSDVLMSARPRSLLLTGLCNIQAVRTAEMSETRILCFVRGKQPTEDMLELANQAGITVITTDLPLFEACGRLYEKGLRGSPEHMGQRT